MIRKSIGLLSLVCAPLLCAQEISVKDAMIRTQRDIQTATAELNAKRDKISAEQQPLSEQRAGLELEVRRLRGEAGRLRSLTEDGGNTVETLEREIAHYRDELNFISTALTEYRRSMESRSHVVEVQGVRGTLRSIDEQLNRDANEGLVSAVQKTAQLASHLRTGMEGGARFRGSCLDVDGSERQGQFVVVGPAAFFADAEGKAAGLVSNDLAGDIPSLHPASPVEAKERIRQLTGGQAAAVPVDLTGGAAMKIEQSKISWLERAKQGGIP